MAWSPACTAVTVASATGVCAALRTTPTIVPGSSAYAIGAAKTVNSAHTAVRGGRATAAGFGHQDLDLMGIISRRGCVFPEMPMIWAAQRTPRQEGVKKIPGVAERSASARPAR